MSSVQVILTSDFVMGNYTKKAMGSYSTNADSLETNGFSMKVNWGSATYILV